MDLVAANKAFRAHPVIKANLSKDPANHPPARVTYDAMQELFAKYPILRQWWEENGWSDRIFIKMEPTDAYWQRAEEGGWDFARDIQGDARRLAANCRGSMTAWVKKELVAWVHNNSNIRRLSQEAQAELKWVGHDARPQAPLKLYRGLLFSAWQFKTDERSLEHPKNARIFLEALKHGHTTFTMTYQNASSWSDRQDIADRFAKHSPATSEMGAMMNWLHNANKFIDRELGLVISATIPPEDILVDISKVNLGWMVHGDEGEFIVRSGATIQVTIEHIYLPTGEISVDKFGEFMNYIASKAA